MSVTDPASPGGTPHGVLDREAALDAASTTPVDVLVVGGGITGVGVALDAVSRGLRVALVERDDLASGTSSKSSKLVHGGLRYLANGDVAMVAEGVRERGRLRANAPHLVRPLGFVVPTDDALMVAKLGAGLVLYDTMALGSRARRRRRLTPQQVLETAPTLRTGFSRGGWSYDDCQTDDARLTLAIAQTARRHGALIANHAAVRELTTRHGRVTGAIVRDELSGQDVTIEARYVVSAAGVWAARVRDLAADDEAIRVRPAKGVHLTFPRHLVPVERALVVPSATGDGRSAFLIPWGEQVYVGTTDDDYAGDIDTPGLDADDAAYLLDAVNLAFDLELTTADAIGAWAGTRPLLETKAAASKDLSRKHAIIEDPPGLITVTGGKLTTYRHMAQETVDAIDELDGVSRPCVTSTLRLGVDGDPTASSTAARRAALAAGMHASVAASLWHRHGDDAGRVAAFCAEHGETDRLAEGLPWLVGEVRWAVRHELARTVDDVLQRRTRMSLRHREAGGDEAMRTVGRILGEELGLDDATIDAQIADYRQRVATERGVVPLPG